MVVEQRAMDSSDLEIVDDLAAPIFFVDGLNGLLTANGVVTMGLSQILLQVKTDGQAVPIKKLVARLSIPATALASLVDALSEHVQLMIRDGTITVAKTTVDDDANPSAG